MQRVAGISAVPPDVKAMDATRDSMRGLPPGTKRLSEGRSRPTTHALLGGEPR
jgi:hypothetical protein